MRDQHAENMIGQVVDDVHVADAMAGWRGTKTIYWFRYNETICANHVPNMTSIWIDDKEHRSSRGQEETQKRIKRAPASTCTRLDTDEVV